jgi:hypothetical protein
MQTCACAQELTDTAKQSKATQKDGFFVMLNADKGTRFYQFYANTTLYDRTTLRFCGL